MRQYIINELNSDDVKSIEEFLNDNAKKGGLPGMFWLNLSDTLLGDAQKDHEDCGPFVFGIELGDDFVSFEFLVRSKANLHCSCTAYANLSQRNFLMEFADRMVQEKGLVA